MQSWQTQADLITAIQEEHQQWSALLTEVGAERMHEPGAMGRWTFKDAAAHLTGWRRHSIDQLRAAHAAKPVQPPWPDDLDTDQINEWMYGRDHAKPLAQMLDESHRSFVDFAEAVRALPQATLMQPSQFVDTGGEPLGPLVVSSSLKHFHEEHEADIRAWLARLKR